MTVYSLSLPSAEPTTPPAAGSSRHGSPFASPLECRPKLKRKAGSRPLIFPKRQQAEHSQFLPDAFRNASYAGSGDPPSSSSTMSLEGLVREHRERLSWTILGCPMKFLDDLKRMLQTKFHDPTARLWAVEVFLTVYKLISPRPPSSSIFESLQLRYGKHLEILKVGRVYSQPSMVMAYIDLDDVESLRRATVYTKWYRKLFRRWPDNEPTHLSRRRARSRRRAQDEPLQMLIS
ncbi:hypothetical protein FPOA_12415 [Fusarium poae]|uniref:Uncharacterized protein n=1 Tax=Fusarium poae TaxID=36050 RepID=A0A1B8A9A5_FUSPO|nr:hypothetical protein FPOA_13373 [Fusarium poae]OBS16415.1 hypothetical protein FPOA_12926 [Fusarium poae]OBS17050.1 hypothetical protein FPOA_12417 [Fusarium poae]OBS17056.1 hypothetical protein FPOA_12415 [Fusarium poae]